MSLRAAAVQLNSTADRESNLVRAEALVRDAAGDGATLVVLPERYDLRGSDAEYHRLAEALEGPTLGRMRALARELGIDLVAGSSAERRDGRGKLSNTSVHIGPGGEIAALYRKIHLFDVTVGDVIYRESDSDEPGEETVVSETADGTKLGLTICYDVRFPELFRILALQSASVITVPANFTRVTGEAHWEVLLRARAIENQVFVIAPGESGEYPPGKESYGNSMIIDPWGEVLARAPAEGECFVAADLDFERLAEVREKLPSLANRVPGAYRWPVEAHV